MPITVEMPRLSDTMEEGTLIKWNVKPGDAVSAGDHLADVETDKATMELQAFEDGTVAKLVIDEGQTVAIGNAILVLAGDGESVEDAANAEVSAAAGSTSQAAPERSEDADQPPQPSSSKPAQTPGGGAEGASATKVRVSPLARKLAEEHNLDLASIQGSGPDGRIIKRDVLKAAERGTASAPVQATPERSEGADQTTGSTPAPAPVPTTLEEKSIPVPGMRKTIAKRLVESKTTVPHFQVASAINMDPLIELRTTLNEQLASQGIKLSVNDFITRATALACIQHPAVNSSWMGDTIQQHGTVNVGTAISLPAERGGGLVVAVVRDVQNKGLRQISQEVRDLAKKARGRGLAPEEMSDSTITISNLGMPQYGVSQFTAIINPPNAAILAVGAAIEKPVVRTIDGQKQIVVGHEMTATISGDHRVIDGAIAAEYLTTLRHMIENPAGLLV
ncbi:dihydrolipoamide acetyltransferase family protein [Phycisphaeraceae bacterium D3-23]